MNGYLAGILITGSRTWSDVPAIHAALEDAWHAAREDGWPGIQIIHGAATGADSIAGDWAETNRDLGVAHHPMPAAWEQCAPDCPPGHRRRAHDVTYCPTAGHRRNAAMVALEPLLAIAFLMPCRRANCNKPQPHDSHGTTDCIRAARRAGIAIREVRP